MLPQVLALAKEAGQEILTVYHDDFTQRLKTDGTPLTAADLASHHAIVDGLLEISPELPILSEESSASLYDFRQYWKKFWLIDPLDGTKEFLKRNGEFTVNIALIENTKPVLGVVYAPALGVSYFAAKGVGAFMQRDNEEAVRIKVGAYNGDNVFKMVGSRSHRDPHEDELAAYLGGGEFVAMGSSLKLCLVADGSAHLYPRLGPTMEWDTAAAHCVVNEAGGIVMDTNGQELRYNKPDLHNPPFAVLAAGDTVLKEKLKAWKW